MALIVGGVTVTGTQTLDATKLTGNLPALNGSSLTNLPASTPSNSDILSGVASASAGAVGSYAYMRMESWAEETFGNTEAGSNLSPVSSAFGSGGSAGSTQSGTWRCMGSTIGNSGAEYNTTVWLRIS